ncbi:MAG: hypothetical protein ACM31E_05920 [Fibrobacterota bacterium]|nr:hypothetical protein [Chitinispirillaceae bacterium]
MIKMLKYACAVIAAGLVIGCSSDKNITIGHPETVEPDKTFDVILANFYVNGSISNKVMEAANRDSLRVVTGLPTNWQVIGASCYAAKDFNIATQLRNTASIDTIALYDTLKTYLTKLQPMVADPTSEAGIVEQTITAHDAANKNTISVKASDVKKWVAFKGAVDISLAVDELHDTTITKSEALKVAALMGVDTVAFKASQPLISMVQNVGFTIIPIVTVLKIKAPSTAVTSDTIFYYSRSVSLSSSTGNLVKQDLGDMTYVPVSVVATPVKRQVAAVKPSDYTMQSSNGNINIVFANRSSSQYAELFRANGSFVKKVIASHGTAQFNKNILESSGSGFVKITNGSSVSVQKLSVVK